MWLEVLFCYATKDFEENIKDIGVKLDIMMSMIIKSHLSVISIYNNNKKL